MTATAALIPAVDVRSSGLFSVVQHAKSTVGIVHVVERNLEPTQPSNIIGSSPYMAQELTLAHFRHDGRVSS